MEDGVMYEALNNCLFTKNKETFNTLKTITKKFRGGYIGSNIVQDDIFRVIENYTDSEDRSFELFRIPVADEGLCACTFFREGRIFVMINSNLILAKQIFAAAHELYHIYCYFEGDNPNLLRHGSILMSPSMDPLATKEEDIEANAFAGLFLVPSDQLKEQMEIYKISTSNIRLLDILTLVEIFGIPYKAMALRLYEEGYINESEAQKFFDYSDEEIIKHIELTRRGKRWYIVPTDKISFGSLLENFEINKELNALSETRMEDDANSIAEFQKILVETGRSENGARKNRAS